MIQYSLVLLVTLLACSSSVSAQWYNCLPTKLFTEFTIFPSPVTVGGTAFIRAVVNPSETINNGNVTIQIYRNATSSSEPIVNMMMVPLCSLTQAITCPIAPGEHVYTWTFDVPDLPAGEYQLVYRFYFQDSIDPSCLSFALTINPNSTDNATAYQSYYTAVLDGTANFEHADVDNRSVGEIIQVGPYGLLPKTVSSAFSYGILSSVIGSGDLVPSGGLDTTNYLWGLYGQMQTIEKGSLGLRHTYTGRFFVGYTPGYDYSLSVVEGTFTLQYLYNVDRSDAFVNGTLQIDTDEGYLPPSWGFPVLVGTLQNILTTDAHGRFVAQGTKTLCLSGGNCTAPATVIVGPTTTGSGSSFTNQELGITIGVILGFAFLVVLLVAYLTWRKNKRETEEEDGVFAVARKPEYGSALILDDIIQETQGKNRDLRPMLDPRRRMNAEDSFSENDDIGYAAPEPTLSREESRATSVSRSQSRRKAPRGGPRSDDELYEEDEEEDESRSRSPISRSPVRRNRSPSRSRSPKRGRSRSLSRDSPVRGGARKPQQESDRESSSEEDPGSSASRASERDSDNE